MSISDRAMLIAARYSSAGSRHETPVAAATTPKATAVAASTSGYRAPIGSSQQRDRPRSSSQDSTGTLSRSAIGVPHVGQALRGRTTDRPAGTRTITTLRNEPISSPTSTAETTTKIATGRSAGPPVTASLNPAVRIRRPYRSRVSVVRHFRGVAERGLHGVRRGVPFLPDASVTGGGDHRRVGGGV